MNGIPQLYADLMDLYPSESGWVSQMNEYRWRTPVADEAEAVKLCIERHKTHFQTYEAPAHLTAEALQKGGDVYPDPRINYSPLRFVTDRLYSKQEARRHAAANGSQLHIPGTKDRYSIDLTGGGAVDGSETSAYVARGYGEFTELKDGMKVYSRTDGALLWPPSADAPTPASKISAVETELHVRISRFDFGTTPEWHPTLDSQHFNYVVSSEQEAVGLCRQRGGNLFTTQEITVLTVNGRKYRSESDKPGITCYMIEGPVLSKEEALKEDDSLRGLAPPYAAATAFIRQPGTHRMTPLVEGMKAYDRRTLALLWPKPAEAPKPPRQPRRGPTAGATAG